MAELTVEEIERRKQRKRETTKAWCIANKEYLRSYEREYAAKNKERKEAYRKEWYAKNRERLVERSAEWKRINKDRFNAWQKEYYLRNIEKRRLRARVDTANSHSRRKGASGAHTVADIKEIFSTQQGKCATCSEWLVSYHVDHKVPLFSGGANNKENLQLLCPTCNCSKGAKTSDQFSQFLEKVATCP